MICIICGRKIESKKIRPVPIQSIVFLPYIANESPGKDEILNSNACIDCYSKILANRAKSIAENEVIKGENDVIQS